MQFFFCWANHDWIRSWEGKREVLQKQEYGRQKEWEENFRYLLPFFRDPRYEKKDNKPLLMIFRTQFDEKQEMAAYLDQRCKDAGFDGLYLIETMLSGRKKPLQHHGKNMRPGTGRIHRLLPEDDPRAVPCRVDPDPAPDQSEDQPENAGKVQREQAVSLYGEHIAQRRVVLRSVLG